MDETMEALERMSNWKAVGPDGLPAALLKTDHPAFAQCFHNILVDFKVTGEVPQHWKDTIIKVLHKKKEITDCKNYRETSLVGHAGNGLLKIVAFRLNNYYCKTEEVLPEEQCGFRPARRTTDMLFVARRLQELRRQRYIPLYVCFIDLRKAYDSVDREL